ncbi:hypothetical protein B0T25DRAFT_113861 [Lasiosphaeria hispida]|uniref:Uncharacterized protein n=1 Tax=Lasiosphaeria hispida TaxID=260671 RepID=A0AAJ0HRI1_9PEZI|nr:hypothetical protein B0T25DRAFT_113861 [Lasiosphaeria hispida]
MAAIISRSTTSPSVSASSVSASTILTSVKSTKDSDPPTVQFTNTQDLFDVVDSTTGDFLTVTNQFTEIERERDIGRRTGQKKRYRKFRFRRYNANSQILIITIPTDLHEALHLGIYMRYRDQLVRNGGRKVGKILGQLHFEQNMVILEEMAEKAIRQAVHGRNVQEQVIGQH